MSNDSINDVILPDQPVELEPGNVKLPADKIAEQLEGIEFAPLDDSCKEAIANATDLTFRSNVADEEPPELSSGDSDSDDQYSPADELVQSPSALERLAANKSKTIIGGAVVDNLCIVIPDEDNKRFADLPVVPIEGSSEIQAQIIASVPQDGAKETTAEAPVLLLPDESRPALNVASIATFSNLRTANFTDVIPVSLEGAKDDTKEGVAEQESKAETGEDKTVAQTDLQNYVLSGDIKNFFGIKGLKAKLYKFKGPGTTDEKAKEEQGTEDQEKTDENADGNNKGTETGVNDNTEKSEEDQQDDSAENTEPAREKVKLNPQSLALKGQPLGTLFPFMENDQIKNLPVENLEFTYCEESQGYLFKPGLRLEVDVLFRDSLQWANDGLRKIFGGQKPPDRIHLSAHLADERDWSKRPKVTKLELRGEFNNMEIKAWDFLEFKTIGVEITATKAASRKSGDKSKEEGRDESDEKESSTEPDEKDEAEASASSVDENEDADSAATETDEAPEPDEAEEKEIKAKDEPSPEQDEKEEKKPKEKKSWNFGFGLFGKLMLTKIPHANAPVEMNYRLARDFIVEDDDGSEEVDDKKDEKDEKGEPDANDKDEDVAGEENKKGPSGSESTSEGDKDEVSQETAGKEVAKSDRTSKKITKKAHTDGIHKRLWNLVIFCDTWEDIYGIKNVTMKKAELKTSFVQGDFKDTLKLDLSAEMQLGGGTLEVSGRISRNDNSLDAELGNLKLSDIKKIHAQVTGHEIPDQETTKSDGIKEAEGHELTFEKLHLNLSSKKSKESKTTTRSLQLDGCVTFNEYTSSSAKLLIDNDGLMIEGDIADFNIPETNFKIQKAGLHIFVAFKHDKKSKKKITGEKDQKKGEESATEGQTSEKEDKQSENTEAEKKADDAKEEQEEKPESKRQSKFALLGVVEIESFTVSVGLYVEQKPDKKKRDWLLFGNVSSIKLNKIWPDVRNGFLDLELDNVALIASSEDRNKKAKEIDGKDKDVDKEGETKSEEKADGEGTGASNDKESTDGTSADSDKPANHDVLAEVESYNYPISKGVQLCATIRKFEALEELNDKKPIDGLVLIVGYSSDGGFNIRVNMPKSFQIPLRDYARLGDFGAAIVAGDEGPGLQLTATLTMLFDDQDPVRVKGVISGTPLRADGELYMEPEDKWVNPFKLNKAVVLSELGVGAGFKYATVLVHGPDRLSMRGKVEVGDFNAKMVMSLGLGKEQVFIIDISKLDVVEIIRLAGKMTDNVALQQVGGGEDLLVFRDLKIYFSTGARVLGVLYERGIHVKGQVTFFDKTGEFDGRFNDDGVMLKAGIDNFKIGGLEVSSARDTSKRATLDVEMTKDTQIVSIDGMIRYYDFELKIFLDANLQKRHLDADVSIKFTDAFSFQLIANIDVPNDNSLEGAVVDFEAVLDGDILGAILDGVGQGIEAIGKLATQTIENAERELQAQIDENQIVLDKLKMELEQKKMESEKEVMIRETEIEEENDELAKLRKELDRLEDAVKNAQEKKNKNEQDINSRIAEKEKAQRRLDDKLREKTEEYNREVEKEKANQRQWENEKKRLQDQLEASWGDDLRKAESADRSWDWWCKQVKEAYEWKEHCWWKTNSVPWWEAPYWWVKFQEANAGLEQIKARKAIDAELRHVARDIMNSQPFKDVERGINDAVREINKFGRALDALTTKGLYGYIQELSKDEREEVWRQMRLLDELKEKSKELEATLTQARNELNRNRGRITEAQRKAQSKIEQLKQEIKLKPFEHDYQNKKQDHDRVVAKIETIQQTLRDVRKGIDAGTKAAKETVDALKKATPRITRIRVKASADVFAKNKPLIFEINSEWLGQKSQCHVEWTPGSSAADLYRSVANKLIAD
ncbi:hypothetical protein BDV25DRAFT_137055 [Aspergillus avenaceus]|uniref:Uncharacterized protein n=1 Tax=Aspergillus avenaceus TaxID=36643 RepID=A0A5N6U4G3_ASPAV|nr:hypothetical protein BDV25DRAFT_137055 [Aspergillus avenaceus]